jgi:flagellar biosynthesis component FlhA
LANVVLLVIMLGAVYTHYALHDKFDRMAPGLVFSLLLLTRLIIHRQVTQREKGAKPEKKTKIEEKEEEEEDEEEENEDEEDVEQQSDDEESPAEANDKGKKSSDKKDKKKNK